MAEKRKLLAEIDKTCRKIDEGIDYFEEIKTKMDEAHTDNQREKCQDDLKKEIKKLQRLRDLIKGWQNCNDVKDKDRLGHYRRIIEQRMEEFKEIERENKTKPHSKQGLIAEEKLDPKEKERSDTVEFLKNCIQRLKEQMDYFESNLESIRSSGGKKKKQNKEKRKEEENFDHHLSRHGYHIMKLEMIMRLIDNESIECQKVSSIKDELEDYISQCQESNYDENEYMYEDLDLEEIEGIYQQLSNVATIATHDETNDANKNDLSNPPCDVKSTPQTHCPNPMKAGQSSNSNSQKDSHHPNSAPQARGRSKLYSHKDGNANPQHDNSRSDRMTSKSTPTTPIRPTSRSNEGDVGNGNVGGSMNSRILAAANSNAPGAGPVWIPGVSSDERIPQPVANVRSRRESDGQHESSKPVVDTSSSLPPIPNNASISQPLSPPLQHHQHQLLISGGISSAVAGNHDNNGPLTVDTSSPTITTKSDQNDIPSSNSNHPPDSPKLSIVPTYQNYQNTATELADNQMLYSSSPVGKSNGFSIGNNGCGKHSPSPDYKQMNASYSALNSSSLNDSSYQCDGGPQSAVVKIDRQAEYTNKIPENTPMQGDVRSLSMAQQQELQNHDKKGGQSTLSVNNSNENNGNEDRWTRRSNVSGEGGLLSHHYHLQAPAQQNQQTFSTANVFSDSMNDADGQQQQQQQSMPNVVIRSSSPFMSQQSPPVINQNLSVPPPQHHPINNSTNNLGLSRDQQMNISNHSYGNLRSSSLSPLPTPAPNDHGNMYGSGSNNNSFGLNGLNSGSGCYQRQPTQETRLNPRICACPLGPYPLSDEHRQQLNYLAAAASNIPRQMDSSQVPQYIFKNPISSPNDYPTEPPSKSDTVEYFEKLAPETLFFIFYYLEGTKAQRLAASALKRNDWRFHKQRLMWFQRSFNGFSKITISETEEKGSYLYFDFEQWKELEKDDFVFQYEHLEDRD